MRTIIRKRTTDYREAFEIIQKEAIPNKYSWTVTYDNDNNEYLVTINKKPDRCIRQTFSYQDALMKALECNRSYLGSWKLEYNHKTHIYSISISEVDNEKCRLKNQLMVSRKEYCLFMIMMQTMKPLLW